MSNNLVVTLTFKILSGPYLDSWMLDWLRSAGLLSHGVTFYFGSAKVCHN